MGAHQKQYAFWRYVPWEAEKLNLEVVLWPVKYSLKIFQILVLLYWYLMFFFRTPLMPKHFYNSKVSWDLLVGGKESFGHWKVNSGNQVQLNQKLSLLKKTRRKYTLYTPTRTHSISGLKFRVLKLPFLALKLKSGLEFILKFTTCFGPKLLHLKC